MSGPAITPAEGTEDIIHKHHKQQPLSLAGPAEAVVTSSPWCSPSLLTGAGPLMDPLHPPPVAARRFDIEGRWGGVAPSDG